MAPENKLRAFRESFPETWTEPTGETLLERLELIPYCIAVIAMNCRVNRWGFTSRGGHLSNLDRKKKDYPEDAIWHVQ